MVSLLEAHRDLLSTISKWIKYIIQNPLKRGDLVEALALVDDIPRLKTTKKILEDKIENLNETRNHLLGKVVNI